MELKSRCNDPEETKALQRETKSTIDGTEESLQRPCRRNKEHNRSNLRVAATTLKTIANQSKCRCSEHLHESNDNNMCIASNNNRCTSGYILVSKWLVNDYITGITNYPI